jgi:hypothetical protein
MATSKIQYNGSASRMTIQPRRGKSIICERGVWVECSEAIAREHMALGGDWSVEVVPTEKNPAEKKESAQKKEKVKDNA